MAVRETWVRTDESEDVAASIRHALLCWDFALRDGQQWKWVMLSLHSALQGACVCHLMTTAAPLGAVTERNAEEWHAYFEASRVNGRACAPRTFLMSLPELLSAARRPGSVGDGSNAPGVKISDSELEWLKRFHFEIRNQLVHFEPMGWSIEVSGVSGLAKVIARIIEEILDIGWAFRHSNEEWRGQFKFSLQRLSRLEHR